MTFKANIKSRLGSLLWPMSWTIEGHGWQYNQKKPAIDHHKMLVKSQSSLTVAHSTEHDNFNAGSDVSTKCWWLVKVNQRSWTLITKQGQISSSKVGQDQSHSKNYTWKILYTIQSKKWSVWCQSQPNAFNFIVELALFSSNIKVMYSCLKLYHHRFNAQVGWF